MLIALSRHAYLLLTLRHPMTGLPCKTPALFLVVASVSAAVSGVRWESLPAALGMMFVLCAMGYLSPRWAAAYALISIGIDVMAIPFGDADLFGYWEAVAAGGATLRIALSKR